MEKVETKNIRFTTLVDPTLLSQLKLISYFTNKKLYESINNSMKLAIEDFEKTFNTKIDSLINLQNQNPQPKKDSSTPKQYIIQYSPKKEGSHFDYLPFSTLYNAI